MISQMTCIQNQIVNHSLDSPAHNRALKNGHIIFFWAIHLEYLPNRFIIFICNWNTQSGSLKSQIKTPTVGEKR